MSSSLLPLLMAWSPCCGVSAYFVPTTLISTPPAFLKSCNRIWDQDSNRNSLMTKTCLSSTHVLGVKFKPSSLYMSTGNEFDSYVVDDFSQLTVAELKDRLRQLHLPVSGRKNDLFERLNEFYAGNANGETELENEPEPKLEENHAVNFDTGKDISSSTEEVSGSEDDPNNFTVAELKERLKKLGLPVGGRKVELIYRLKANTLDGEHGKSNETADEKDEGANPDVSAGNNKHDTANIDSLKGADNDSNESISLDDTSNDDFFVYDDFKTIKSASDTSENAFQRRARRKKYWKTQEVRELIRANNPSAIEKAEEMIATLEYMAAKENNEDYLPGPNEYTALIDAYATSGTSDAPARAEKIISRIMEANERSARAVVIPTASMSDAIMKAYANLGTREAAEQATAILNRMDYMREHNPNSNCKPSVFSYAVAISAWTRVGTEDAAKNAETILGKLFDAYDEVLKKGDQSGYVEELKPNSVAFNSVIDAW